MQNLNSLLANIETSFRSLVLGQRAILSFRRKSRDVVGKNRVVILLIAEEEAAFLKQMYTRDVSIQHIKPSSGPIAREVVVYLYGYWLLHFLHWTCSASGGRSTCGGVTYYTPHRFPFERQYTSPSTLSWELSRKFHVREFLEFTIKWKT